jgi:hypothetical protein
MEHGYIHTENVPIVHSPNAQTLPPGSPGTGMAAFLHHTTCITLATLVLSKHQ